MENFPIVLFAVKNESDALLLDASSQTNLTRFWMNKTPNEYSEYFHYYIKKYKNIDTINLKSTYRDKSICEPYTSTCTGNSMIETRNCRLKTSENLVLKKQNDCSINNEKCGISHLYYNNSYFALDQTENLLQDSSTYLKNDIKLRKAVLTDCNNSRHFLNSSDINFAEFSTENLPKYKVVNCRRSSPNYMQELPFNQSSKYNFKSNSLSEAITMSIMIGVNTVVEIIAGIAVNFCIKIPDKDYAYPGTGCVLMDYLNEKIDGLIIDEYDNSEFSTERNTSTDCDLRTGDGNNKSWIDQKLEEFINPKGCTSESNDSSLYKYNGLTDALLKNCYHKADESKFDPIRYSENTPYLFSSSINEPCPLKSGFF